MTKLTRIKVWLALASIYVTGTLSGVWPTTWSTQPKKHNFPPAKPNQRLLRNGTYLVRTQAGMRQAIKHFVGPGGDRRCQMGWPGSYPSVCRISHTCGGVRILALHVNEYRKQTQALLDDLKGE